MGKIRLYKIQCPFYKSMFDRSIICESPEARARSATLCFNTQSEKDSYVEWCCYLPDGGQCAMHRAIMKKYED